MNPEDQGLWLPVSVRSCQSQLMFVFNKLQKHLRFTPLLLGMPHWWKNVLEIFFLFPHSPSNGKENKIRLFFLLSFFLFLIFLANYSKAFHYQESMHHEYRSGYLPREISYFSVSGMNAERHSGKSPGLCLYCRMEVFCLFTPKDRSSWKRNWEEQLREIMSEMWMVSVNSRE